MLHVGSRSDPSVWRLLVIVVLVLVVSIYAVLAIAIGDWMWWNPRFTETPKAIVVHCYGKDINIDPGTYHFDGLTKIINESLSGRKNWNSLTMSDSTYKDYQDHPQMKTVEAFYHEPVRIPSMTKYFSAVDTIIIPLDGRHSETNAVFGRNNDKSPGGSLHIESTDRLNSFLDNMDVCPANAVGSK